MALDPATGKPRWAWKGLGPGYASPLSLTAGGVRQLITLTNGSIVGIDAATGASLWSVPFPDDWHENIASPVWTGSHVVVSGTRQGTHAYALSNTNGTWAAKLAWKNPDVTMYTSSPVFADGRIYGLSAKRRGQFVILDAATGAVKSATEGRDGNHASILVAPEHVLFLTDGGRADRDAARLRQVHRGAALRHRPQRDLGDPRPACPWPACARGHESSHA